jgi:hypothetical protein
MTNAYLMRHLVPLLNITYRISQADFGLRYAQTVYSIEDLAMIEQFFKANSIDTINHSYVAFKKRFEALKNELSDFNTKDKV